MSNVLDNPKKFGFKDATCTGDGKSDCIWNKDSHFHTTSHFNEEMAKEMVKCGVLKTLGW